MADEETQPEEQEQEQRPVVSALDPDFLFMAFLAIVIDVLDFLLEFGTIVSLILGAFFIAWMMWKTGQSISAQQLQKQHLDKQAEQRAAKAAVRRALRRGILIFIAELIPLVNLIPFWTIFVFSALRAQNAVPSSRQNATIPQEA